MKHEIQDIDMKYEHDTMVMACKMAMATIHTVYDNNMDCSYIPEGDMRVVEKAMKVLCMAKDLLNEEPVKKTTGVGVIK